MKFIPRHLVAAVAMLVAAASAQADVVELRPYPRAKPLPRYDNPLEVGNLPISPPERSAGGKRTSRHRLPYEGKVSMQQYKHEPDDSPLLIARHYAGQLKEQGFELVTICDFPCTAPDGGADASVYWHHEIDTAQKLSYSAYGDRGTYLIGHRADAVVAVRVGTGLNAYVSTVKTISAPSLDRAPLLTYVERQSAPAANAPLPPPPSQPTPPADAMKPSPHVVDVPPGEISAWLQRSKGLVVLQLSSYQRACTYCMPGNVGLNALAEKEAGKGITFARVAFQPWTDVGQSAFAKQYGVLGIPDAFTFQDGRLVRRLNGAADEAKLRRELLDGLFK